MLSPVTTIVTVVAWSELTDLAVVVNSKSNLQAPLTSKVTPVGSALATSDGARSGHARVGRANVGDERVDIALDQ